MLNRNHVLRTLMGASLWWAAGCQSDAFVDHEGTVRGGTSVPLSLQVHFGADGPEPRDGQMVACVSLPSGWQAPSGTYVYSSATPSTGTAQADAELVSEAQSAWPVSGFTWHCLVSERLTTETDTVLAAAALTLPEPSVAQGPYRLRYLSGFRNVSPTSEGEPPASPYQPANFTGRLERLLHVNVAPATTFDQWTSGTSTGTEAAPSVTRAWHGNGTFLAGSSDRTQLLRSANGTTWTSFEPLSAGTTTPIRVEQLVYSQLRWLGLSEGRIVVSTDNAFTWSPLHQAPPRDGEAEPRRFLALALSGNTLAAVGTAGLVATSRDGATWTDASVSADYDLVTLAAGQGGFLAVAIPMATGPSDASALARPRAEGGGWELLEPATLSGLGVVQLAGGNGRFVAYAEAPPPPPPPPVAPPASPAAHALQSEAPAPGFYRSEDLGSTWARVGRLQIPSGLTPSPLVAFVDQSFVVSWTGTPPQNVAALPSFELHVSADAMEWTAHPTGAGGTYTAESFATGGTSVVAVSPRRLLVATRVPWAQPVFVTERLDPFRVGTNYLVALDARGSGTLTFELEGTLPPGLTFRPTGSFHGTPTQSGSSAVTVRARDARGGVAERTFSVDVVSDLSISSGAIPSATQGSPYEARFTASGGRAPYAWNLAGGTLPAGLTLQQTDGAYVLSGRPTLSGNFALTVRVTDSANQTAERSVSLQIVAPPPPTDDGGDAPGGCGCNGGGAGVQALGLAALAMVARIRRQRRQA